MAHSVRYYVDVLGFTSANWGGDDFTCVTRDGATIYLAAGAQGQAGTPENYPWAHEMRITDPGGHVLRFGSEPKDQA